MIKDLGHDRDKLIHSIFSEFEDGPPPHIVLRHVQHPKGVSMKVEKCSFTLENVETMIRLTLQIHEVLMPLIKAIALLQNPEILQKARSQAGATGDQNKPIPL